MSGSITKAKRGLRPKPGLGRSGTGSGNSPMNRKTTDSNGQATNKAIINREMK